MGLHQLTQRTFYWARDFEQIFDKTRRDFEVALVFSNIATLMVGGKYSPYRYGQAEGTS